MSEQSASAIARNAERNNDKLFPIFQKNLSSDNLAEFATAAEKLSGWLSRDKAYYARARPMIIALMETAHETVRRHSGSRDAFHISKVTDTVRPWAEGYVKILRTVVPFALLFSERTLQLRLRVLIQGLCENVDTFLSQQKLFSPSAATSPTVSIEGTPGAPYSPPSALHSPAVPLQPALPRSASADSARIDPAVPPRLTEAQIKAVLALAQAQAASVRTTPIVPVPAAPSGAPAPSAPAPAPSSLSRTNTPRASSANSTPPPVTADPAMNNEQSRPKAKKRKTAPVVDLDFIDADLTWYKETHAAEASTGNEDATTSTNTPTAGNTPSLAVETPISAAAAPTSQDAEDAKPPAETALATIPPPPDEPEAQPVLKAASLVSSRSPSIPLQDVVRTAPAPQAAHSPENETANPTVKPEPAPQSPVILAPSLTRRPTETDTPPIAEGSSSTPAKAPSPLAGEPLPSPLPTKKSKKRKRGPPGLRVLPMPPEPMAVDPPPSVEAVPSGANDSPESTEVAPAAPAQPAVNGATPPIDTQNAMEVDVARTSPTPAATGAEISPFASTSARVLAIARGASAATPANRPIVLEFELSEEELAQIARWTARSKTSSEDLTTSLCATFASYPISQLQLPDASPDPQETPEDIAKCGPPAPWPQDGSAFVCVNAGEDGRGGERFTISPPFITTVDKCVDLGSRGLRAGLNTLHLFQYRDHSEFAFAALLHRPTRAQLAELQAARDRERDWRAFIEGLGRIELRVPPLFPPTMLNGFANHT